jgi:Reverse transcriptase (RNA-dependent DNA polymerase)
LSRVDYRSRKELWAFVNPAVKGGSSFKSLSAWFGNMFNDFDGLIAFFANIATDPHYDSTKIEQLVCSLPHSGIFRDVLFNEYEVFNFLSKVKKSLAVVYKIPYWLFCKCAGILASVVTHIFNIILSCGICPAAWKCAVVTPIPKVSPPTEFKDLRPIYVIPILSQLYEHLIVSKFLLPALPLLNDQFAFRPTGSIVAALVYVLNHITRMLEDSSYVRCLFIAYSRAFDTINHERLIRKLLSLAMPSKVVRWIVNFSTGRSQAASLDGKLSNWLPSTQSIVRGSGIGPILHIIFASDLKLQYAMNFCVNLQMIRL